MAGKKGCSGRKKSLTTLAKEALANIDQRLPELFEDLFHKALLRIRVTCPGCGHEFEIPGGGDREATFYLIDRRLGKTKATTEIDLTGGEGIGLDTLKTLIEGMARRKIEIETRYKAMTDEEREAEAQQTWEEQQKQLKEAEE